MADKETKFHDYEDDDDNRAGIENYDSDGVSGGGGGFIAMMICRKL